MVRMKPIDMARGLMAHDPSNPYRQGYTIGNALIAVAEQCELDAKDVAVLAELLVRPLLKAATEVAERDMDTESRVQLIDALELFGVPR
jgi:hypothetical protein